MSGPRACNRSRVSCRRLKGGGDPCFRVMRLANKSFSSARSLKLSTLPTTTTTSGSYPQLLSRHRPLSHQSLIELTVFVKNPTSIGNFCRNGALLLSTINILSSTYWLRLAVSTDNLTFIWFEVSNADSQASAHSQYSIDTVVKHIHVQYGPPSKCHFHKVVRQTTRKGRGQRFIDTNPHRGSTTLATAYNHCTIQDLDETRKRTTPSTSDQS